MRLYHMDLKFSMYKADYLKKWFIKLKNIGFDGVVVEIDNKLVFPSHPDFAAEDALSAEVWNEIVKHGKRQGLVVYPLLQTLGHMEHILKGSDKYVCLAETPGEAYMLCPSKKGTLKFIQDLVVNLINVFDHPPIIHLGGDEVYGFMEDKGLVKCPLCMNKDSGRLLNTYLVNLAEFCVANGVQPEFWADEVLSYPEHLVSFPKNTRFVDWLYTRTTRYSNVVGHVWGAKHLINEMLSEQFPEKLPAHLKCMLPYLIKKDQQGENGMVFNHFYGAEYIKDKGYQVVIASGVRYFGDSYAIPRLSTSKNVKISDVVSTGIDCDHLVTSWAVRLTHPETTWPLLGVIKGTGSSDEEGPISYHSDGQGYDISTYFGPISKKQILLLADISEGLSKVDISTEQKARFERPYYDSYNKTLHDIWVSEKRKDTIIKLTKRIKSGKELLTVLSHNLVDGKGDRDCLRHWINGIKLCLLRSEQAAAIIDSYSNGIDTSYLLDLLQRNKILLKEFEILWCESVTKYALEQEKEIKFLRDIRVLDNLLCK